MERAAHRRLVSFARLRLSSESFVYCQVPAERGTGDHVFDGDLREVERELFGGHFVAFVSAELVARDDDLFESKLKDIVFVAVLLQDRDFLNVASEGNVAEEKGTAAIGAFGNDHVAHRSLPSRYAGTGWASGDWEGSSESPVERVEHPGASLSRTGKSVNGDGDGGMAIPSVLCPGTRRQQQCAHEQHADIFHLEIPLKD